MKKKIWISFCMILAAMLGGCGNQIPDMTPEQREAVSEYAAGLLLKYDTNQSDRLVDLSLLEEETTPTPEPTNTPEPEVTLEPEATSTPEPTQEPAGMDPVVDTPTVSVGETVTEEVFDPVESTLLLPAHVTLGYSDYQVTDTYTDIRDAGLTLEAASGNKLLVARFQLLNSGSEAQQVDMLQNNIKYSLIVDGTATNCMVTLLSNDLITYMGSLNPDESKEVVLLAEVKEELLQEAESIAVELSCGELISRIELK